MCIRDVGLVEVGREMKMYQAINYHALTLFIYKKYMYMGNYGTFQKFRLFILR